MIILRDSTFNDRSLYVGDINFGGKAKGLITMKGFGLNVPSFFVVSDINGDETFNDVENLIYEEIRKGNMDPSFRYSVRSSATVEDGKAHSFAGIFETYLDVDIKDIGKRVIDCVKSMSSRRTEIYLLENYIPKDELKMNVIIQRMVYPDYSGVLFTSNPKGIISESVIVLGEGTGDNVVLGKVPTTTVYYSNFEDVHYEEKQEGGPDVDNKFIKELKEKGKLLEANEGHPCDIEFCIKNGQIYYLQLRPVTHDKAEEIVTLDNSNLIESYPGICLPLSDTFVREAYGGVFNGLVLSAVKNPLEVEPFKDKLESMVTSSSGRMYYKINNWYYFLSFMPFHKRVIKIWQDSMGIRNRKYEDIKDETSIVTRLKARINIIKQFFKNKENMDNLNVEFTKVRDIYEDRIIKARNNKELRELYNMLKEKVMDKWYVTLINDMYSFIFTSLAAGFKGRKKDNLKGIRDVESLKPLKELSKIASMMDEVPIINTTMEAEEYLANENEIAWRINDFINEYGDRINGELKLEIKTYRTNPELIFGRIKELKKSGFNLEDSKLNDEDIESNKEKGFFFKRAAEAVRLREISRLNRTRLYGMVREMFLLMAYNLKKANRIDSLDDVFYLTKEELFKEESLDDLKRIIEERKKKYKLFEKLPSYNRIEFKGEEFDRLLSNARTIEMDSLEVKNLIGEGASEGKVTGLVTIIHDPTDVDIDLNGRIVVASFTDPGWIYIISQCSGLIVEMGSILSHSAIITREIGKPSIVGVKNATRLLRTGDLIEMDGREGTIEILERIK